MSEVWGVNRNGADAPTGKTITAHIAPAPHARHDRSMARSSFGLRDGFEEMSVGMARRVQRPSGRNQFKSARYELIPHLMVEAKSRPSRAQML